jgi:hypothetical protein
MASMADADLIAELRALGVQAAPEEDRETVTAELQSRIVRFVTSSPQEFDRNHYTQLMGLWTRLQTPRHDMLDTCLQSGVAAEREMATG